MILLIFFKTVSLLLNLLLVATLSKSSRSADSILLRHYFLFNGFNQLFSILPSPYCDLNGFGSHISTLGASLSMALMTFRSTSYSRYPQYVWTAAVWLPLIVFARFASMERNSYTFSDITDTCAKDFGDTQPVWILLTCSIIFCSVLTLLLGGVSILGLEHYSEEASIRKKYAFVKLFACVLVFLYD